MLFSSRRRMAVTFPTFFQPQIGEFPSGLSFQPTLKQNPQPSKTKFDHFHHGFSPQKIIAFLQEAGFFKVIFITGLKGIRLLDSPSGTCVGGVCSNFQLKTPVRAQCGFFKKGKCWVQKTKLAFFFKGILEGVNSAGPDWYQNLVEKVKSS